MIFHGARTWDLFNNGDPATSTIFWLLEAIKCQVRDIKVRIVPTSFALNQAKRSLAES